MNGGTVHATDGPVPGAPEARGASAGASAGRGASAGAPTGQGASGSPVQDGGPSGGQGAGPDWRRVHPVTPLVRGWAVLVVLVLGVLRQGVEQAPQGGESYALGHVAQILLGILGVVVVVGLVSWWSWRVTAYAVDADSVHMRSGIVRKQHRRARLDRIQAIDVRQPLVARLFGLAELKVEVAGGSGSSVAIGFLTEHQAQALRADLLARVAGAVGRGASAVVTPGAGPATAAAPVLGTPAAGAPVSASTATSGSDGSAPPAPGAVAPVAPRVVEEPGLQVYEVPPGRLVVSTLLRAETVVLLVVVAGTAVAVVSTGSGAPLFSLLPFLIGLGSALFGRFNRSFAFRAATSPDGIRLHHGLTETRSQTIPVHRVQAVELYQPLLWRPFDWWRVQVNVAGYVQRGEGRAPTTVLLPVGTRDEAVTALWLVLPDLGVLDPRAAVEEGLAGLGESDRFTGSPRRARVLDPLAWRRTGFSVLPRAVLARGGRLRRRLVVVPHSRTQSLGIEQGPWQRRRRLATFVLHSTPGPVSPRVPHLDEHVARALLDEQARRAREARAHDVDVPGAGGAAGAEAPGGVGTRGARASSDVRDDPAGDLW